MLTPLLVKVKNVNNFVGHKVKNVNTLVGQG